MLITLLSLKNAKAKTESFKTLVKKSDLFDKKTPFPTQLNRIQTIAGSNKKKKKEIADQANSVRPIMHSSVEQIIGLFLAYKREFGSDIEKSFYAKIKTDAFVDRLLINRPLMFMTGSDQYLLRDGQKGAGGFESIGTSQEVAPLLLKDYLSYDEMQIAALLGVSVSTFFINNGNRNNSARPGIFGTFQEQGVCVGLVGARFEKPGRMEWQHMIITPEQNNSENGYGVNADQGSANTHYLKIWETFYGDTFATYDQAALDMSGRYIKIAHNMYLDTKIYKKRMQMAIVPFLLEANRRGVQGGKKVYCHVVGLGLGIWQKTPEQAKIMMQVYADCIREASLSNISDIDFSWFPESAKEQRFDLSLNPDLNIHFSKRNPADKLINNDKDKLLVAMYAWDGNAYPGNEYWAGYLTASRDPAAACYSTIAELQNPLINSNVSSRKLLSLSAETNRTSK